MHYALSVFLLSDYEKWIIGLMADLYHIAYMDETGHAADDAQMFFAEWWVFLLPP